jgi:hypothetical protein
MACEPQGVIGFTVYLFDPIFGRFEVRQKAFTRLASGQELTF